MSISSYIYNKNISQYLRKLNEHKKMILINSLHVQPAKAQLTYTSMQSCPSVHCWLMQTMENSLITCHQ